MVQQARRPIIAVVGAADCDAAVAQAAFEVGRLLARAGCIVLTGGRTGVMEAASAGATSEGGTVIGILPGESADQANRFVEIPIVTGLGEARNVIIARTADGLIALTGEYGTLSEIAFALKFNKPVVSLHSWDIDARIRQAHTPQEAVALILKALSPVWSPLPPGEG
jgi:uncharacterized protein (TIGR00725 family)